MSSIVKEWFAENTQDNNGNYVRIKVRESGFFSFLLSLLRIDPTTTLEVNRRTIVLEQGSLYGFTKQITPIRNINMVYYGYTKPWLTALIIATVLALPTAGIGVIIAIIYYILGQRLEIGFRSEGMNKSIKFGYSIVKGKKLSVEHAEKVVSIIEKLITAGATPTPTTKPTLAPIK